MDTLEGITVVAAGLGVALGLINTVWALWRDRVRVRVTPMWGRYSSGGDGRCAGSVHSEFPGVLEQNPGGDFGVRVTNLGFVEVTISSVGFTPNRFFDRHRPERLLRQAIAGDAAGLVAFPIRMPPRSSVIVWAAASPTRDAVLRGATRVYASTACGMDVFATSRLLKAVKVRLSEHRG